MLSISKALYYKRIKNPKPLFKTFRHLAVWVSLHFPFALCSNYLFIFNVIDNIYLKISRPEVWSANTIKHWLRLRLVPNGKLPHTKVLSASFYLSLFALKSSVWKSSEIFWGQLGSMLGKRSKRITLFSWHILATNKFSTIEEEQMSNFRSKWTAKVLYKGLFMSEGKKISNWCKSSSWKKKMWGKFKAENDFPMLILIMSVTASRFLVVFYCNIPSRTRKTEVSLWWWLPILFFVALHLLAECWVSSGEDSKLVKQNELFDQIFLQKVETTLHLLMMGLGWSSHHLWPSRLQRPPLSSAVVAHSHLQA